MRITRVLLLAACIAALIHAAHGFAGAAVTALRGVRGRAVSVRPQRAPAVRAYNDLFPELHETEERENALEKLVAEYGRVALLSHLTIQGLAYLVVYNMLKTTDLQIVLQQLPAAVSSRVHVDPGASVFAATFIIVKLTLPGRLLLDAMVTPKLAYVLQKTPLAGPLGLAGDLADPVGQILADFDIKPLNPKPSSSASIDTKPLSTRTGTMTVTLASGITVERVTLASGKTVDVPVDPTPTLIREVQIESAARTEA